MRYSQFDPDRDDSGDTAVLREIEVSLLDGETVSLDCGRIGPDDIDQLTYENEITEQQAARVLAERHIDSRIKFLRYEA